VDPGEDRGAGLGAGAVVGSVDQLDLEGGKPAFGDGVVQAGAGAAHGAAQPQPLAGGDAGGRGVFGAAVGVKDRAGHALAAAGGHGSVQGAGDQGGVVVGAHRPAEQLPRCQLQHAGQVQPALVGGDPGHIAAPGQVDLVRVEQAPQQIRRGRCGGVRPGQATPPTRSVPDDAVGAHEPLDALAVHRPAAPAQLGMHPRRPVGALGGTVDGVDLCDQHGLGLGGRCRRGAPSRPGVEA
jgi:hypothetical protein